MWGPNDRLSLITISIALLTTLSAMLFGYAVNFKLFGLISLSSSPSTTPSFVSRQKKGRATKATKR